MKKKLLLISLGLFACIVISLYLFNINSCSKLKLNHINLSGFANIIIGTSINTKDLLIANYYVDKNGEIQNNIITMDKKLLCKNYEYGDLINDTLMLVFDVNNKPFIFNIRSNCIKPFKLNLNPKELVYEFSVQKYEGKIGLCLNEQNHILFENIYSGENYNIFNLNFINYKSGSIVSFDILDSTIIVCIEKDTKIAGICDYEFFIIKGNKYEKIYSLNEMNSLKCDPVVKFVNNKKYLISYFDKNYKLQLNQIDEPNLIKIWCINKFKILNLAYFNNAIYLTVRVGNEQSKKMKGNNFDEMILSGISIFKVANKINQFNM